jgi:hypothetical protein
MGDLTDYKRAQDLLFQELWEREKMMGQANVEEFIRLAERAGYSIDDLLKMLNSGMSVPEVSKTVLSKLPEYQRTSG